MRASMSSRNVSNARQIELDPVGASSRPVPTVAFPVTFKY